MRAVVPGDVELSVVVPALNEADSLPFLVQRIGAALRGRSYEILVIDDGSDDETPEVCRRLRDRYPLFLHVRLDARDGLGGAVVYGMSRARGEYLVVMDADLQHPPEQIPELLDPIERDEAEFVLGSRYVAGGSTDGRWGPLRRVNSRLATVLARPFAGPTTDPMSGFFALRADTYLRAVDTLRPHGYKIALELLCKCRVRRVREIPIRFGVRQSGSSKLTLRQRLRFLDHLSLLADHAFPRAAPWVKLATVNACAWLIAFGLDVRLVARDVNPALAPAVAFAAALAASAVFQLRANRLHGKDAGRRWLDFSLIALGQWSACTLSARWIANHVVHATTAEVFALTFATAAVVGMMVRNQLPRRDETSKAADAASADLQQRQEPTLRDAA